MRNAHSILKPACWGLAVLCACVFAFHVGKNHGGQHHAGDPASRKYIRHADLPTATGTLRWIQRIDQCRTNDDYTKALADAEFHSDKTERKRHLSLILRAWLEHDPKAALAAVRNIEILRHDAGRAVEAFVYWAHNSPSEAADLIRNAVANDHAKSSSRIFIDGVNPPDFVLGVIWGMTRSDPDLTSNLISGLPSGPFRKAAMEVFLTNDFPSSPQRAITWAAGIPDEAARMDAIRMVAEKIGQSDDPLRNALWAKSLGAEAEQTTAVAAIAAQWSQRHARDAFTWAIALEQPRHKWAAMPFVIKHLTLIDPGAAADWLNQFDAAPEIDASVAAYVRVMRDINPEAAAASLDGITNPKLKDSLKNSLAARHRGDETPKP